MLKRLHLSLPIALLAACSLAPPPPPSGSVDPPELLIGEADQRCGFPEGTALIFAGQTTPRAVGLTAGIDHGGGLLAHVYVTRDPVEIVLSIPFSRGPQPAPTALRAACAVYPDGLVGMQSVPDDWRPPE